MNRHSTTNKQKKCMSNWHSISNILWIIINFASLIADICLQTSAIRRYFSVFKPQIGIHSYVSVYAFVCMRACVRACVRTYVYWDTNENNNNTNTNFKCLELFFFASYVWVYVYFFFLFFTLSLYMWVYACVRVYLYASIICT